jgi:hypothetical protein
LFERLLTQIETGIGPLHFVEEVQENVGTSSSLVDRDHSLDEAIL